MIRIFDILLSLFGLVVFLPFGIVIALILKFTGEGEIFYRQERLGKGQKPFGVLKFATMVKNSPNMGSGDVTVQNDPRVLPFGNFLRKTKLNEVPQLWNIFVGDMSFVGPRPQTPKNFEYFPPEGKTIIASLTPGLTGIGSIVFRDEESIVAAADKPLERVYHEDIGPYKAELEKWYAEHRNILNYWLLILVTAWVVFASQSTVYRKIWPSLPPVPNGLKASLGG
jgi:lipopolysaccharide/colanic/teichoic acid biosynthesis glycosyltransferase